MYIHITKNYTNNSKYSPICVTDFLIARGHNAAFETFDNEELAMNLHDFYGSVRQKPKTDQDEPKEYSKTSYCDIRAGIQRFLTSPP